jgi:hypothetical protein
MQINFAHIASESTVHKLKVKVLICQSIADDRLIGHDKLVAMAVFASAATA